MLEEERKHNPPNDTGVRCSVVHLLSLAPSDSSVLDQVRCHTPTWEALEHWVAVVFGIYQERKRLLLWPLTRDKHWDKDLNHH